MEMENVQFKAGDKVSFISWVGKKSLEGIFIKSFIGTDKKMYAMIKVEEKTYRKLLKDVNYAS